jgi:acetylornithine/succinyldiaminopimelate/putrescine aminotransferase
MAQTNPEPIALEIVSAKGMYLYDLNENAYLDLISGISVCSLGHNHPVVENAMIEQIKRHSHIMVYGEVIQNTPLKFSQWLTQQLPPSLNSVYFVNSGSEAIDASMKLAKKFTGKSGFIAQNDAYHGSGQGPLSLMNNSYFTLKYRPLLNNIYYIKQNEQIDFTIFESGNIAAVVCEFIQAERGCMVGDVNYIQQLFSLCKENDILFIADEIQTGFYRTGLPFAFMHYNIIPDILVLGKALGGSMPMGAIVANKELMSAFSNNPILGHITTFGGHPICSAAGLASNEYLFNHSAELNIPQKEKWFKELLVHDLIVSVNGVGLLLACHLNPQIDIVQFNKILLAKGVFTDWFLFNMNAIRIAPPLIISEQEIRHVCQIIVDSLNDLSF